MSLFYNDENIIKNENELKFNLVIDHLEERFKIQNDTKTLITLIGFSWYYFIEGDVAQNPIDYDSTKFFNIWKKYIDIGLNNFSEKPEFCLIAGYTLMLHGFYIDIAYERIGVQLLEKCLKLGTNDDLIELSKYWLYNHNSRKYKVDKKINLNKICNNLFNSNTFLDKYFNEILKTK